MGRGKMEDRVWPAQTSRRQAREITAFPPSLFKPTSQTEGPTPATCPTHPTSLHPTLPVLPLTTPVTHQRRLYLPTANISSSQLNSSPVHVP